MRPTDLCIDRTVAARARVRAMHRRLAKVEERRAELEMQAGAAMLTHESIPADLDEALARVQREASAVRAGIIQAEAGVSIAEREDAAASVLVGLAELDRLLPERAEAAAELVAGIEAAAVALERLHLAGVAIYELMGRAATTMTADGVLVNEVDMSFADRKGLADRAHLALMTGGAASMFNVTRQESSIRRFYELAAAEWALAALVARRPMPDADPEPEINQTEPQPLQEIDQ